MVCCMLVQSRGCSYTKILLKFNLSVPHFGVLIKGSYYLGYYTGVPHFRKLPYPTETFQNVLALLLKLTPKP